LILQKPRSLKRLILVPLNNRAVLLVMLCSIIMPGCLVRHTRLQPLPELTSSRQYLHDILFASEEPSDLSGILQMKISSPRATVKSKNVFLFKKPAFFRLETLGFLSQPAMVSLTDGETMGMYIVQDMRYYSGPATPDNILKILGISISIHDMLHILLGAPPVPFLDTMPVDCRRERSTYHFRISDGSSRHDIWIDPSLRKIVRYSHTEAGSVITEITYDDFKPVGQYLVPLKITYQHAPTRTQLQLSYDALNAASIAAERFLFTLPPQTTALSLDDFPSTW